MFKNLGSHVESPSSTFQYNIIIKFIQFWPWLHLITLFGVMVQPSTPAVILGRFSRNSFVILIALLVAFPIVIVASVWLRRRIERYALVIPRSVLLITLVINALLLFLIGRTSATVTNSYILLSLYIAFVLLTTLIWLCIQLNAQESGRAWFWTTNRFATVVMIAIPLVLLALATRFPGQLWTDEGYNTSLAVSIMRDGKLAVPMFQQTPELYGPIYSLVYMVVGVVYQVLGIALSNGRLVIYAIGLLSLVFISRACVQFYSVAATRIAIILAAFTLLMVNYLRADIEVALLLSLAFWAFSKAYRTGQLRWHLGVGLAVGFSLDGHPNAYRFIVAFAIAYFIDYLLQIWRLRTLRFQHPIFLLLVGLTLGFMSYIIFYTWLAPNTFLNRLNSASIDINLGTLFSQLGMQVSDMLRHAPFLFAAALFGLGVGLQRRTTLDRLIILVLVVTMLWLSVGYGYYRTFYMVHSLPLYIVLAVSAFDYLERKLQPSVASFSLNALLIFAVITLFGWLTVNVRANRSQDYSQAVDIAYQIRSFVSPQETFIGADPLYFEMVDYPNFVEFNSGVYMALRDGINEQDVWERINPTSVAIIIGYPIPPPASLLAYVEDNQFTLVHCWEGDRIGRVDLYMKIVPSNVVPNTICDVVSTSRF